MASTGYIDTGARLSVGGSTVSIHVDWDYNVSRLNNTVTFTGNVAYLQYVRLSGGITSFTYGTGWDAGVDVPGGTSRVGPISESGTRNVNAGYGPYGGGDFSVGVGAFDTSYPGRMYGRYRNDGYTYGNFSVGIPTLGAPSVDSQSVTNIKIKTASVNYSGSAGANATFSQMYLDYGLTAGYGTTVSSGSSSGTFNLTGLKPGTVYHYRLTAVNGGGKSTSTGDLTFKTKSVSGMTPLLMGLLK